MRGSCPKSCKLCVDPTARERAVSTWKMPDLAGTSESWDTVDGLATSMPVTTEDLEHCRVSHLLSKMPVEGMSIVCLLPPTAAAKHTSHEDCDAGTDAGTEPNRKANHYIDRLSHARLVVWKDAHAKKPTADTAHTYSHYIVLPAITTAMDLATLITIVAAKLNLVRRDTRRPLPALYSQHGAKFLSLDAVARVTANDGVLCFSEGGVWVWPPGPIGTVRSLQLADNRTVTIKTLSDAPVVLEIESFLSPDQAAHIQQVSAPHLHKSPVSLKDSDVGKAATEWRTSSQYFLTTDGDKKLEGIDAKLHIHIYIYIYIIKLAHHLDSRCVLLSMRQDKSSADDAPRQVPYHEPTVPNSTLNGCWFMSPARLVSGPNGPNQNTSRILIL